MPSKFQPTGHNIKALKMTIQNSKKKFILMKDLILTWRLLFLYDGMTGFDYIKFGLYYAFLLFNVASFFHAGLQEETFRDKIEVMCPCYAVLAFIVSFAAFFKEHRTYFSVINQLQDFYELHKSNPRCRVIIVSCQSRAEAIVRRFFVMSFSFMTFFVFGPTIIYLVHLAVHGDGLWETPVKASYPRAFSENIQFFISYTIQFVFLYGFFPLSFAMNSIPVYFSMAIVSHLKIAKELFKDIPEKERPDKALELLHVAIKAHLEALELLQKVNCIGNEHYFVIVFSAGLSLGFALFQLVSSSLFKVVTNCIPLFCGHAINLYVITFNGQQVIDELNALIYEIYNVPWYSQPAEFRRCVRTSLARAQATAPLMAWKFAPLSSITYRSVMTTAYSYVAFFNTMAEDQK